MTQFNYCKTTICRHLLFLVLALSFGFTAQAKDNTITLPPTSPHFGPSQINVIFDHYTPGSRERVRIILYNGAFSGGPYDTKLRKNADGTQGFAITENLVLPTQADLKIGKRAIPIIMVPEGKLTITLDSTNVKFDGDYAALCTELQTVKDNLETSGRTFFDDIRGMTPLQYKQIIVDTYQANKKAIDKAAVSKACKTYARVQLDINYIGHLLSYKTYLSMSNMISKDSTAQKNLETPIDSASFFKGLAQMSILRSVNQRYYPYYCELDNKPLGIATASEAKAQLVSSNPLEWMALAEGNELINGEIEKQINGQTKTAMLQNTMAAEFNQIHKWEKKYNSYLKSVNGYASSLKACTHLYDDGVKIFITLAKLKAAIANNPQGIVASMSMNNLYIETATELVSVFNLLNDAVAKGGTENMLTGADRSKTLWALNDKLSAFQKKLNKLYLSIRYYTMSDVWNGVTAGMIDRSNGEIATQALGRWRRAAKVSTP